MTRSFWLSSALLLSACLATTSPPPPMTSGPPPAAQPGPAPAPPPAPPPPPVVVAPPPAPPPPPVVVVAPPPPAPPPVVGERADDKSDRRFDRHSDWDKLGERWVDGKVDRDVIKVGKKKDRYRMVALVVEHSALELYDVVITFGDGSTFSPPTRLVFAPDSASRVIDLPGDARNLRSVEFRYGNLPGGGRAQIELWAKDARDDDHDGHDGKGRGRGRGRGHR